MCGARAEADIFYLEPEPEQIFEAGAVEKWFGSATLILPHTFFCYSLLVFQEEEEGEAPCGI